MNERERNLESFARRLHSLIERAPQNVKDLRSHFLWECVSHTNVGDPTSMVHSQAHMAARILAKHPRILTYHPGVRVRSVCCKDGDYDISHE